MGSKSLKKNAIYAFFKTFMNIAFPIITFPYASRILTPESIGKVNFSNSITVFIKSAEYGERGNLGVRILISSGDAQNVK